MAENDDPTNKEAVRLHNARIYTPEPSSIQCLTFNTASNLLALSRADSSVEIWCLAPTTRLQRRWHLPTSWASVEGLCWGPSDRLFCCGLHGHVLELDLNTLSIKSSVAVVSGACWCLDVHLKSNRIAAGTEEGYITILDITYEGIQFNRTLDKQEGRVLCVSWSPNGTRLASGSPDAVRVWDTKSGHALHRLTTGRDLTNKRCLVWCVKCLNDTTFISGDSRGRLCFWDLVIGVSIEEHQALRQDILCLSVTLENDAIFCSGVDPRIVTFSKLETPSGGARTRWTRSHVRDFHTHDVRCLAALGGTSLASGGVDTNLIVSSAPPRRRTILPHLPYRAVSVASGANLVLLSYAHHLELHPLLKAEVEECSPQVLLRLDTRPEHTVACAAISHQANWIAYSTQQHARFFTFEVSEGGSPVLEKVRELPRQLQAGSFTSLEFSAKDARRAVVAIPGFLLILELNHQAASILVSHTIPTQAVLPDLVHLVRMSHDRKYLVAADLAGNVAYWTDKKWQRHFELPKRKCEVTAMAIPNDSKNLLLVYADHEIVEFDLLTQNYTEFRRSLGEQKKLKWFNPNLPITGISFESSRILFNDSGALYAFNKKPLKPRKLRDKMQTLGPYKHVIHAEWLPSGEIFTVRVTQAQLEDTLPPAVSIRKIFGTHV